MSRAVAVGLKGSGSVVHSAAVSTISAGLVAQALVLIAGILVARSLGPEGRGNWALLLLLQLVIVELGCLGLPEALVFFVGRDRRSAPLALHRAARVMTIVMPVLIAAHLGLLVLAFGVSGTALSPGLVSLLGVPLLIASQLVLGVRQGQLDFRTYNVLRILPAGLYCALVLALSVVHGTTLFAVAAAYVVANGVTTAVAVRQLPRHWRAAEGQSAPTTAEMLRFGLRGLVGSVSPTQSLRLDQFVVASFLSPFALGLYVVALAYASIPQPISQSLAVVAFSTIAAADQNNLKWRHVWRFAVAGLIIAAGAGLLLALLARVMIPLLFSAAFSEAIPVAILLLCAGVFAAMRRILGEAARGLGLPGASTASEFLTWILIAPGLLLLMPRLGSQGVALTLLVMNASASVFLSAVLVRWHTKQGRASGVPYAPPASTAGPDGRLV